MQSLIDDIFSSEVKSIIKEIDDIFSDDLQNKMSDLFDKKLVHYTSAVVAREIIEKEQLWLRKTTFMNDYSEIIYGKQYFDSLLEDPEIMVILNNILKPLTNLDDNLSNFKELYHNFINDVEKRTYISCLSEHLPSEDAIGRLSMWRAYSNSSGVALVINPKITSKIGIPLNILPVTYSKEDFKIVFINILKKIEDIIKNNIKDKQLLSTTATINILLKLNFLIYIYMYVISLKHQGFWEEREWRIILSSPFSDTAPTIPQKFIERSIENIKGNPEVIYKLNLKELSFINPKGESLLEKIIIGPTANSEILVDSFSEILKNKGFDDEQIKNMITVSNIPLRY